MDYRWEINEPSESLIDELRTAAGISRAAALALADRGVSPPGAHAFLHPALSRLSAPYSLPGTRQAAERLWQAVMGQQKILVYGDYDTDGVTSAVLLCKVLSANGAQVECYLPHRIDDGYGLTPDTIAKACDGTQALLVTVDCGITSADAVAAARARGLDIIVTDHHEPQGETPAAVAVVDPKLPGAPAHLHGLAGVGVAFKVCHAFVKYGRENGIGAQDTDLREFLDLVALGTVADIVPILEENRSLVSYGLQVLSRQHRPGVRALCELSHLQEGIDTGDITFRLAPRLNAAGRLGNAGQAFDLLHARNTTDAYRLASALDDRNRERQEIEHRVLESAEEQILDLGDLSGRQSLIVCGEQWHQGVIGIVASRLVRKYSRPSIVLTHDPDGRLCGSGRSVRGINLVTLLERCSEYLDRYGGHAMAAGLALAPKHLDAFSGAFEDAVGRVFGTFSTKPTLEVSGLLEFADLDEAVFSEMEALAPFGHNNPEPVFATRAVYPERVLAAGKNHSRGTMTDASGARHSFICFGTPPNDLPPAPWDIAYIPHLNRYNGSVKPQLKLLNVRMHTATLAAEMVERNGCGER